MTQKNGKLILIGEPVGLIRPAPDVTIRVQLTNEHFDASLEVKLALGTRLEVNTSETLTDILGRALEDAVKKGIDENVRTENTAGAVNYLAINVFNGLQKVEWGGLSVTKFSLTLGDVEQSYQVKLE